ncbi:MAG TPA: hypothetical protein VM308_00185 [Sphingomicrobium sp.]|nr:hypothetical protein [Sphingomicrobium sp.]
MVNRRNFLILASAALLAAPTSANAQRRPRILFVCQFGSVKSPIARELLKRAAQRRGVRLEVSARGITPEDHISAELKARLASEGINPAAEPLRQLRPEDVAAADLVVGFAKLPPKLLPRHFADWTDLPSMNNDYIGARALLDVRIEQLLDTFARR